ncbi:MAG: histidine phosphatase family protein [Deltaproteobacteria bacterium]|nr:histidine phosphatase family protein [Deltaproteobacteria bacterium]
MTELSVYLVRHEEAEEGGADAYRALTEHGRRRIRATARFFAAQEVTVDRVVTSPLVRAVQTAEILVGEIGFDGPVLVDAAIVSPVRLESLTDLITSTPAPARGVALVGHEPILGALVGELVGASMTGFRKGEILALTLDRSTETFRFRWRILPDGPTRVDEL